MKNKNAKKNVSKIICGAVIGIINGFFGGGGGMVCVPYLESIYQMDNKKSHATTLAVILPLSCSSLVVYFIKNNLDLLMGLYVSVGAIIGGILGAVLLKKLSGNIVRLIFAIIMLVAGFKMVL